MTRVTCLLVMVAVFGGMTSSVGATPKAQPSGAGVTINIALKANFGYLPAYVMIQDKLLERYLPGITVKTTTVNSALDAAQGFVAGQLDATLAGTTTALTAWAQGVPWKILSGASTAELKLVTNVDRIKSIADIQPGDKIAYPAPASIQDIILAMAAKQKLGNAKAFEKQLVQLTGPDSVAAMQSHQLAAAFLQSPDSDKALTLPGAHVILDSKDIVGNATLAVFVLRNGWASTQPEVRQGVAKAYRAAMNVITTNPAEAAQVAVANGMGTSADSALQSIQKITWTPLLNSIDTVAQFMYANGFMSRKFVRSSLYVDETPPTAVFKSLTRKGSKLITRFQVCDDSGASVKVTERIVAGPRFHGRGFALVPKSCAIRTWSWTMGKKFRSARKVTASLSAVDLAGNVSSVAKRSIVNR